MSRVKVNQHVGAAVEILPAEAYRTSMWYAARRRGVTASEIATIVGLSPYDSRFNLWWAKRLGEDGYGGNRATSRGRRVEPLVLEDFADEHPEWDVLPVGLLRNIERPWQLATPDAVAVESHTIEHPVAVVEAKTAGGNEGWGQSGTDEVPLHYRAQVLWQMDTLGLSVAYLPVWIGFDYRCYVVEYDAEDAEWLRHEAEEFLGSLDGDPPALDAHSRTTQRLKRLHPDVVDDEVEVNPAVVNQYLAAARLRDAAQSRMDLAENRLRAALGDFARGVIEDPDAKGGRRKVVSRSVFDVPAATYERKAYRGDRLTVSKPRTPRRTRHAP